MVKYLTLTALISVFLISMSNVQIADAKKPGPDTFGYPDIFGARIYIEQDGALTKENEKEVCECPNAAATCKCRFVILGTSMEPGLCFEFYRNLPTYSWETDDHMYFDCGVRGHDLFDITKPGDHEVAISKAWIDGYCTGRILK